MRFFFKLTYCISSKYFFLYIVMKKIFLLGKNRYYIGLFNMFFFFLSRFVVSIFLFYMYIRGFKILGKKKLCL